jgi:hypothetical protein
MLELHANDTNLNQVRSADNANTDFLTLLLAIRITQFILADFIYDMKKLIQR